MYNWNNISVRKSNFTVSGKLPISDAAEVRKMERMKKKTSSIEEVSSYLLMTEAAQVRTK